MRDECVRSAVRTRSLSPHRQQFVSRPASSVSDIRSVSDMGSSKRSHKDKERSRSKRSRSRSADREERRSRKDGRHEERRDMSDDGPEEGEITPEHENQREDVSLSIEETNKLRAKLGLKPLEDESSKGADGDDSYDKRPEVFVKTDNISDKLEAEKVRERIAVVKEKRKFADKLRATKALADSDSEDDVVSWVQKSRDLERQKADQKAKELEERDREMERQQEEEISRQRAYRQEHLTGLTVAHSIDSVKEGSQVILTLRDTEVLEDRKDDVLENVNLVDDEKAAENVINRKKGLNNYNPYDLGEDGEGKNLLSKYDETIDGKAEHKFRIGSSYIDQVQDKLKSMREAATNGKVHLSLEDVGIRGFASEFYTEEEMQKFKKPKKVRKKQTLRKRAVTDDIVPESSAASSSDLGSRSNTKPEPTIAIEEPAVKEEKATGKKLLDADQILQQVEKMETDDVDDDLSGIAVDDDAEKELQEALERARKLRDKTMSGEQKVEELARKNNGQNGGRGHGQQQPRLCHRFQRNQ